jgi:hypothetical protein
MKIAILIRFFGLSLLAITMATYTIASLLAQTDLTVLAYFSWFLSVVIISSIVSHLVSCSRTSIVSELILTSMVFLIFSWSSIIFSFPSIEQNYITHIRAEPILQAYELYGKIIPLEEHASFPLHYLVLYISKLIVCSGYNMGSSFLVYCNFMIIFTISLSISILIRKITGNIIAAILIIAYLANMISPAQLERGLSTVMAIFWLMLLWFSLYKNGRKSHILSILITIVLVNSNALTLIFLSTFLILLLSSQFIFRIFSRSAKLKENPRTNTILLLSLCVWSIKIIYDTLSFLYFKGYMDNISRIFQGLYSFFSEPFYNPVGGSLKLSVQLPSLVSFAIGSLRLISFLSFVVISLITTFYAFYILARRYKQEKLVYSYSILLFYLVSLGVTTLFYIATLSSVQFWDMFGIFLLYIFTPSLLLALTTVIKDLIKRTEEENLSRLRRMLIFFLLFVSLTSLLQIAIYPSGGSLTLVEFRSYGQYYYYKKAPILFMTHVPNNINIEILDDSILAQNIELFSKIGSLPSIHTITNYLPSNLKAYIIDQFQAKSDIVYNCMQYRMVILRDKMLLYKL